jgi:hypothetical protein
MTYRNRDGHCFGAIPSGRALILRTKPLFGVLAADAVSIAIAAACIIYFAAQLVRGAL